MGEKFRKDNGDWGYLGLKTNLFTIFSKLTRGSAKIVPQQPQWLLALQMQALADADYHKKTDIGQIIGSTD